MSAPTPPSRRWPAHVSEYLKNFVIEGDDHLDSARRRFRSKFGGHRPRHLAAYRGYADATGATLIGRVLASKPLGGPQDDDGWWDNLLNTYRRFESDEVPDVPLVLRFRDAKAELRSDHEGYWQAELAPTATPSDEPWDNAMVSLADGTLMTPQPVLQIGARAQFGVISDIDDTVLHSSILDWKLAAQLTFLHNARTRKPLQGVAKLYQALQRGGDGQRRNPVFYVSSSPWNLYDLLDDFFELNAIPFGPIFLRDLGFDPGKFLKSAGHGHKLERAKELILRFPQLRWVLVGDSGQADAELYSEAAKTFGERILAIYIRDVDGATESPRDAYVDRYIEQVGPTKVPMLRVSDSLAIAEHAHGLGLIADDTLDAIANEVQRDRARPTLGEAAGDAAKEQVADSVGAAKDAVVEGAKDVAGGSAAAVRDAVQQTKDTLNEAKDDARALGRDVERALGGKRTHRPL